jgi:CRP/FNR family transcriptional regulator, cyclic AMP receptor protein
MEALELALKGHPFARTLSDEQLHALAQCTRRAFFEQGASILREQGDADTLHLIVSGRVVLEQNIPGKGAIQLEELHAGDVLGLSWILPGGRWTLDARAAEPSDVLAVDARLLTKMMDEDPRLGVVMSQHLIQQLYERLVRVRLQRLDLYRAE